MTCRLVFTFPKSNNSLHILFKEAYTVVISKKCPYHILSFHQFDICIITYPKKLNKRNLGKLSIQKKLIILHITRNFMLVLLINISHNIGRILSSSTIEYHVIVFSLTQVFLIVLLPVCAADGKPITATSPLKIKTS